MNFILLFGLVLAASLVGIATRPTGDLALIWPANAILLGVLVRFPRLRGLSGILGAALGYMAADLGSGGDPIRSLWLASGNLAGVACGYLLYRKIEPGNQLLEEPTAVPLLIAVSVAASASAGLVGALIAPLYFHGTVASGWVFWFVTELANYLIFLPTILAWPGAKVFRSYRLAISRPIFVTFMPAASLVLSAILSVAVGGPGAAAFPIPALLWCAVSYDVFATAVLTLAYCTWVLTGMSVGYLENQVESASNLAIVSLRLGVSFIALGPVTVASVLAARNSLLLKTRQLADYDTLTGLLNRRAFYEAAKTVLQGRSGTERATGVLVLDIDHFKSINDRYGHAVGDCVLQRFSNALSEALREKDITGRLGGEEFAVVLPNCDAKSSREIAERIRAAIENVDIALSDGDRVKFTVSVGGVVGHNESFGIEALLNAADSELYKAKRSGRNMVSFSEA